MNGHGDRALSQFSLAFSEGGMNDYYPGFINPEDHLVCKTYMTRVEGENTRLRHYLARLHRKTLYYSKSLDMLKCSIRLLLHYLRFRTVETIV